MFCKKCGKHFSEDKGFCNICGGMLEKKSVEQTAERNEKQRKSISAFYVVMATLSVVVAFTVLLSWGKKWLTIALLEKFLVFNKISFTPFQLWDKVKDNTWLLEKTAVDEWKITILNVTVGTMAVLSIMAVVFSMLFAITVILRRRKMMLANGILAFVSYSLATLIVYMFVKTANTYADEKTLGNIKLVLTLEKTVYYNMILYATQLICSVTCAMICKVKGISAFRIFKRYRK